MEVGKREGEGAGVRRGGGRESEGELIKRNRVVERWRTEGERGLKPGSEVGEDEEEERKEVGVREEDGRD